MNRRIHYFDVDENSWCCATNDDFGQLYICVLIALLLADWILLWNETEKAWQCTKMIQERLRIRCKCIPLNLDRQYSCYIWSVRVVKSSLLLLCFANDLSIQNGESCWLFRSVWSYNRLYSADALTQLCFPAVGHVSDIINKIMILQKPMLFTIDMFQYWSKALWKLDHCTICMCNSNDWSSPSVSRITNMFSLPRTSTLATTWTGAKNSFVQ